MTTKTVLVTGASRGLGLCLAREALDRSDVVFATCRNPDGAPKLQELAASDRSGRLTVLAMDVVAPASVEAAYRAVSRATPKLDILYSNAGTNLAPGFDNPANRGPLAALEPAAMAFLFETNVIGTLNVLKSFQPLLAANGGSTVACISSDRASIAQAGRESISYSISKTGLNMLIKKLVPELQEAGIRILAIHPGWLRTDMGGPTAKVDPKDAAAEIVTLAETPSYATGSFLRTDGTELPW